MSMGERISEASYAEDVLGMESKMFVTLIKTSSWIINFKSHF